MCKPTFNAMPEGSNMPNRPIEPRANSVSDANFPAAEMFTALASSSLDAMIVIDRDGKIVRVNAQAEGLLGYAEAEVIGQTVDCILDKPDGVQSYWGLQDSAGCREAIVLTKGGTRIPAMLSRRPVLDPTGCLLGQVGVLRDLRDIRHLQTGLKLLTEASRALTAAGNVNTMLAQVLQYALLVMR